MKTKAGHIVVLDDDEGILRSLARLFGAFGHHVQTFSRARDLLAAPPPDLPACLILDQNLGSARGTDTLLALRKKNGWATIPTIFLTADWDIRTVVSAMRNGADDYLTKPYAPDDLFVMVDSALARSRREMRIAEKMAELRQRAASLTPRERAVIRLVVSGMLNKQIADRLGVALVTVKAHRGRAMQKLGAKNAADLARLATLGGIIPS